MAISGTTPLTQSTLNTLTRCSVNKSSSWITRMVPQLDGVNLNAGTVAQLKASTTLDCQPLTPSKPGYSQIQKEAARKALDTAPGKAEPKKREPQKNLWDMVVSGVGEFGGKVIRGASDVAGSAAGFVVENNPLALASRAASGAANLVGAKDVANFLGGADRLSKEAGKVTKSAVRGVGEFGAGTVEGVAQIVADPVGTVKALGVLASSGLDAVPVVGELYSRGEAAVRGTDLATVRAEKQANREAIVNGFVQDYKEKEGRIGAPGALISTLLDVGVPTRLAPTAAKLARKAAPQAVKLAQETVEKTVEAQKNALTWNSNFRAMAPEQKAAVRKLANDNAPHLGIVPIPFQVGRSEQALSKLIREGRLQNGNEGAALLGELKELNASPVVEGLNKRGIFKETVETVVTPGICNQAGKGTCAVTTTQFDMATQSPADFVKTARGLTSPEGQVDFGGTVVKRNESGRLLDDSGRRDLDRVMQSSFMDEANRNRPGYVYDNAKDAHVDRVTGKELHGGLWAEHSAQIRSLLLKQDLVVERLPFSADPLRAVAEQNFIKDVKRAADNGTSVQVGMSWGGEGHAVTITRVEGDFVYGRNPWGGGDVGQGGVARTMLDNEGRFKMKTSDFFAHLNSWERLR